MKSISIKEKIESYFNNTTSKVLDGLSQSSDSLFINSKKLGKNMIIVTNNNDGFRLLKELEILKKPIFNEELIFIPGTEEIPYDMVDSDKYLSSSKNLNLIRYLDSKSENITIITTAKNLQKRLIPKNTLEETTIVLKKKQ